MSAHYNVGITEDAHPSEALRAALAVLALPPVAAAMDELLASMISGGHCIRSSLAVRDYLVGIGHKAKVVPTRVMMRAFQNEKELHSLGIGMRGGSSPIANRGDGWDGHLVVTVEDSAGKFLIDPSIGAARRDAWAQLPSMIVTTLATPSEQRKLPGGAIAVLNDSRGGYRFDIVWLPNLANNVWRHSPEAAPDRRASLVRGLLDGYELMRFSPDAE